MKKNYGISEIDAESQPARPGRLSGEPFSSADLAGDETLDALFGGDLRLYQKKQGYRFSIDSILLADFATIRSRNKVIDLGTGNGIVPLILAYRYSSILVTGVEIQPQMADRAARNIRLNGYEDRIVIAQMDIASTMDIASKGERFKPESFDSVICNPPYRQASSGRLNLASEKQIARHELKATLDDFVRAAAFLLKNKGCFACIQLGDRTVDLVSAMRSAGLEPKRLRTVHAFSEAKASIVLVEAVKRGRKGVDILPPLILYDSAKNNTAELNAIAAGPKRSI
jgi:tRNA1Val (adenine37-N6)-methyltransferase